MEEVKEQKVVEQEEKPIETEEQKPVETEKVEEENKVENEGQDVNPSEEEAPTEEIVEETEPSGNGIRVEDLVTKDELADRFSALEAKIDAIIKENQDLKDQNAKLKEDNNGMKAKYEEKDFGGFTKQGVQTKDRIANDTFEEYAKQFC